MYSVELPFYNEKKKQQSNVTSLACREIMWDPLHLMIHAYNDYNKFIC